MARVYIETSFFSACVTERNDAGSVYRKRESLAWWASERQRHEVFVAAEVIRELSAVGHRHRLEALSMTAGLPLLAQTNDVLDLAAVLIAEKLMPSPLAGDALHVAVAALYEMDYLLSWNVRHLANVNKVRHLQVVCHRMGIRPPMIVMPPALWENRP